MEEQNEAPDNRELYALLNLSPEASDEEIRRAYRQWAQVYHPDKYQSPHVCLLLLLLLSLYVLCYLLLYLFAISSLALFSSFR